MLRIRDATPEDAERIAEINAAGWRQAYRGIVDPDRLDAISTSAWAREIRANLGDLAGGSFSLVAEDDEGIAGSCFVVAPSRDGDLGPEVAELAAIYVEPARWRRGVGRALIAAALGRATGNGFREMSLWTLAENDRAFAFYEALGWSRDGSERIHPRAGAATARMRRALGRA